MVRGRSGRAGSLAAIAAAIGLALASAPAVAGDANLGTANGVTYIRDQEPIAIGQPAAAAADCPAGTELYGIGADAVSTQLGGILSSLRPEDGGDANSKPDDGWFSEAANVTGVDTTMETWAICSEDQVKYRFVDQKIRAGRSATVRVPCPDGTKGTSGGLENISADNVRMNAMYPFDGPDGGQKLDDGWAVRATNIDTGKATVRARAMCASGVRMEYRVDSVPLNADDVFGISASGCLANQAATGGGVRAKSAIVDEFTLTAFVPGDVGVDETDMILDDRFAYEGVNDHPTVGGNVKFFSACLSRP